MPNDQRNIVEKWTQAHNDEAIGQAAGWSGASEEGHAEDARAQAMKMMASLDAKTFGATLKEITTLNQSRLSFWDHIVAELKAKKHSGEKIPAKNIQRADGQTWAAGAPPKGDGFAQRLG